MIKAVIFDMDGVLVDSEPHHVETELETFKYFGADVSHEANTRYKGTPLREHFEDIKKQFDINAPLEEMLAKQNKFIQEIFSIKAELFPNAEKTLRDLKKTYKLGLATSTERKFAEIVLKRFNLQGIFEASTCGDEISRGKPDPEIFTLTSKKLDISAKNCVVVEDSVNGMKAAKAAGMDLIAFRTDYNQNQDFSLADFVVEDLKEIPGILETINRGRDQL